MCSPLSTKGFRPVSQVLALDWKTPYLAFHERIRTTKIYVRDCTPVPPLALMIFAGGEVEEESPSQVRPPYVHLYNPGPRQPRVLSGLKV